VGRYSYSSTLLVMMGFGVYGVLYSGILPESKETHGSTNTCAKVYRRARRRVETAVETLWLICTALPAGTFCPRRSCIPKKYWETTGWFMVKQSQDAQILNTMSTSCNGESV